MPPPRFEFDYVCRCDGVFSLSGSMEWSYPDEASPGFLTPDYNHNASLAGDPGEEGRDTGYAWVGCGDAKGDAIMLSENRRLTRAGTSWSMAAPGVTANVIQAAPAVEGRFGRFSRTTLMYDGVTGFTSNAGPPSFALHTSRQSATATLQSNRYVFSGLTAGAAFDATDTLTVTATPPGGSSTTVTVAAP